jgi:hypothetical protein
MTALFENFHDYILITSQGERSIINEKQNNEIINSTNLNNFVRSEDGNHQDVAIVDRSAQPFLSDRIYQYLVEDPDNLFKNICLKDNLKANFQAIALAKISGKSLTEIATELNVDLEDLINFFQDCCFSIANSIVGVDFSPAPPAPLPNFH